MSRGKGDKERNRDTAQALGFRSVLPLDTTNRYQPVRERRRRHGKGILIMFGLIPFASKSELSKDENVFDRLMNVFDEPFMQSFHVPDFKVDVKDNGESYDLTAELPGLKKEDISLTYENNYLTIATKSEQSKDEKDDKGNYVRRERSQSSMSRSFYIDNIDEGQATADYKAGVLSVHLPKTEKAEDTSHTIAVGGAA